MIALICTLEPYRIAWLPQFVRHYRGIGVERFLLALQLEPAATQNARDRDYASFLETLASLDVDEAYRWEHEWSGPAANIHESTLQDEQVRRGDWVVWCDSDELQVYPAPLPDILAQCEAHGVDYVRGVFIDRVAADYSLAAFDAHTSLWDTFPRTCNVTAALARGDPRKVVVARGSVKVSGGKHYAMDPQKLRTIDDWVQVHHFKWDATLLDRLRARVRPEWQARFPWWVESQRLLDYFAANNSHFNPADLTLITLTGPNFIAFK